MKKSKRLTKEEVEAMREAASYLLADSSWHAVQGQEGRETAEEYVRVAFVLAAAAERL